MNIRILDGLEESDLAENPELNELLKKYNLKVLEANIETASKTPEQDFPFLVLQTLKKMRDEIGELAKKKRIPFYSHAARVLHNEYQNVFAAPNKERVYNIIGYNIFFIETKILLNRVNRVIELYQATIARQEALAAEKI